MPRCGRWRGLLAALVAPPLAAAREPGRLWPEEPPLDASGLRDLARATCQGSAEGGGAAEGGGPLAWLLALREQQGRVPDALAGLAARCGQGGAACGGAWADYAAGLLWPLGLPVFLAAASVLLHCACSFVACCRCCRRLPCCGEGHEPRETPRACVGLALAAWALASAGILGLGFAVQELSFTLHASLNGHMCAALRLADEAVGGTEAFLGTGLASAQLRSIGEGLDVDGSTMRTVRGVIQSTEAFARRHEELQHRISHFMGVLAESGPLRRVLDHRCVFCSLAVGDPQHPVRGFPPAGLLPALLLEIGASSSEAMDSIRDLALAHFVGASLTALARTVKRAAGAVQTLDAAFNASLVGVWGRRSPSVAASEAIRLAAFVGLGVLAAASGASGWLALLLTRLRARAEPEQVPSGKPHCLAWCCGLCLLSAALLLGGGLAGLAAVAGEGCVLVRRELATAEGFGRHAAALGLDGGPAGAAGPLAVELAGACLAGAGSGDMAAALGLPGPLAFQPALLGAFYRLDAAAAQPAAGRDTARLLAELRAAAAALGGLFVLDPPPAAANGSLGLLPLSPNVRSLLLGSGLAADDAAGPDGYSRVLGLNSFAALIAGPGKYTFLHGTAGGGYVITPASPTDAEMEALPVTVRSALLYARAKEQLLASPEALRCDTLEGPLRAPVERRCSVREFERYVAAQVGEIEAALERMAAEAEAVESQFSYSLKAELLPLLRGMRDARTLLGCGGLWDRLEAFETSMCDGLAPVAARGALQTLALAAAAALGVLVQYKIWRRLKDNKVLKYEVMRFEERLRKFDRQMAQIRDDMHGVAAQKAAWAQHMHSQKQGGSHEEHDHGREDHEYA